MAKKILLTKIFKNEEFASQGRHDGLEKLSEIADTQDYDGDLTGADAPGVVGVIANSAPILDSFYEQAEDLRIVARWGVGYENANVEAATKNGVLVTITPVHMDTVAEYAITQ